MNSRTLLYCWADNAAEPMRSDPCSRRTRKFTVTEKFSTAWIAIRRAIEYCEKPIFLISSKSIAFRNRARPFRGTMTGCLRTSVEYLRCFSAKRYMLLDVKYNTTHFLNAPYTWDSAPYLFHLAKTWGMRVLNVTRKNYLRFIISSLKAQKDGSVADRTIRCDCFRRNH